MNMQALAFIFSNSWALFFFLYSSFLATTACGNLFFNWIGSVTHTHTLSLSPSWDVNFFIKNAYKAAYFVKVYNVELSHCILSSCSYFGALLH